jgi:hypothetical protein
MIDLPRRRFTAGPANNRPGARFAPRANTSTSRLARGTVHANPGSTMNLFAFALVLALSAPLASPSSPSPLPSTSPSTSASPSPSPLMAPSPASSTAPAPTAVEAAVGGPAAASAPPAPADNPAVSTTPPTERAFATPLAVAVLDLKANGDVVGVAKALTTLVTSEVGSHRGYTAVSRNELRAVVAHQTDQQLLGCDEPRCFADIGRLAQAGRVIAGSVERGEGGVVVFSLTLVDPEGPVVLDRVAYTWRSAPDDMVELARPAVDRLLLGAEAATFTGDLDVLAPAGATVVVDDRELGAAPVAPVRGLGIGVHRVQVRKPGFVPWDADVAVSRGETHVVQVDLVDEASLQPWYARWYVWGSALAGVVVVGGTAAGIATWQYLSTPARVVVGGPAK